MTGWARASTAIIAIAACSGPKDGTLPPPPPTNQGVVLGLRTPEGAPDLAVWGNLGGGSRAYPDASGFVYYVDVTPGRIQVSVDGVGYAIGHGAPDVQPGGLSVATVVPLVLEQQPVTDPLGPVTVQGDGLRVEIPAGVAEFDGQPAAGPWTIGHKRIREADRYSVPGDQLGLRNDTEVSQIVIDEIVVVRGWTEDADVAFPAETPIVFTIDLPEGSPMLDPGAEVRTWLYSGSRTYWSYAPSPLIDPAARTATFEVSSLGWWAIGREMPPTPQRSCVTGQLLDQGGAGLVGAEVRLYQQGAVGVDRVSTVDGLFCLPIDPNASGELRIVGVDSTRENLFTYSATVTGGASPSACGPGCTNLGTVPAEVWPDGDGDRSWSGPGGDCDDVDPGVNPNPTLGDGSYCGDRL
jgi:hypothetical protein